MAVREFYLINEKGQEFSLMDFENYCFLSSPDGLGIDFNFDYEQIGNNFVESMKKINQGKIQGRAYFKNYDNFLNFSNFVFNSNKLKFKYVIPYSNNKKTFYTDINIVNLPKAELDNKLSVLISNVQFDKLSTWYETKIIEYSYDENEDALIWDFPWDSYFVDYGNRDIEFINNGQIDSTIELEVDGEFENITLQLFLDNELYQEIPITVRVENYEKLFYSSKVNEFEISKILTNGNKVDLFTLDNINYENDNVLRIPSNKNCKIRLDSNTDIVSAKLTVFIYYYTV